MALFENAFGGIDLLKTVTELDKRVAALEGHQKPDSEPKPEEPAADHAVAE